MKTSTSSRTKAQPAPLANMESINPANGQVLRTFEPLTPQAIKAKIVLAHHAFTDHADTPLDQRALWMRKLASLLEHEQEELATLATSEMGKTIVSARQEIAKCIAACRYYADNAARLLAEETIATDHSSSYVRFDPLGVILAIMPWNFPFWQVFRFLTPALMAGNVCLLKHAPNVPQCALAIEALVRRAGFPRGTFQTLLIDIPQVESVLADERIAAVTVTGSVATGKAVGSSAGSLIKKSVLELGGSDPFIVMPSANLDAALEAAVQSRTLNNGQSCIAAKRFIIHQSIYADFQTLFVAAMEELIVGDPMKDTTQIGPLATEKGLALLQKQVEAAKKAGATVLTGGERMLGIGNFYEPTVLAKLPRTAAVYKEEFFGPVALLFSAASLEEAITMANDTPFGLGASVWTSDEAEQKQLIAKLQCGQVFVNTMVASDPRLPFGGIKRSGYGRELAGAGMREFLNAKTIVVAEASVAKVAAKPSSKAELRTEEPKSLFDGDDSFSNDLEDVPDDIFEPSAALKSYETSPFRDAVLNAINDAKERETETAPPDAIIPNPTWRRGK